MFSHEKLDVYRLAVEFHRSAQRDMKKWDCSFAVHDQLARASESIVMNLATGASLRLGKSKIQKLDYALGSTLESAACIDIAEIKGNYDQPEAVRLKQRLATIASKSVALRKSWESKVVREPTGSYEAKGDGGSLFLHEDLDVYQVALQFNRWFVGVTDRELLGAKSFRMIDGPACSLALNIAEGNGRFSTLDHCRILEIAKSSAVKAAAGLDLAFDEGGSAEFRVEVGKQLLERCVAMLVRFVESQHSTGVSS